MAKTTPRFESFTGTLSSSLWPTVLRELDITIRLLKSNATGFLFIFMGGLLSRVVKEPLPLAETIPLLTETVILGLLCSYIFDIANQTSSPDEDYINKPARPIPAGLMTIEQATTRWVLTCWGLSLCILYLASGQ